MVEVWDSDLVGFVKIHLSEITDKSEFSIWAPLVDLDNCFCGEIQIGFVWVLEDLQENANVDSEDLQTNANANSEDLKSNANVNSEAEMSIANQDCVLEVVERGTVDSNRMNDGCFGLLTVRPLRVKLNEGKKIDLISQTDPFVVLRFGGRVDQTQCCESAEEGGPSWSDEFRYELETGTELIFVELWDSR